MRKDEKQNPYGLLSYLLYVLPTLAAVVFPGATVCVANCCICRLAGPAISFDKVSECSTG
jgi:hypothetical protein